MWLLPCPHPHELKRFDTEVGVPVGRHNHLRCSKIGGHSYEVREQQGRELLLDANERTSGTKNYSDNMLSRVHLHFERRPEKDRNYMIVPKYHAPGDIEWDPLPGHVWHRRSQLLLVPPAFLPGGDAQPEH